MRYLTGGSYVAPKIGTAPQFPGVPRPSEALCLISKDLSLLPHRCNLSEIAADRETSLT